MPKISDERRAERREQVLLAAMRCVAAEGFHKTTMADVIRASGLSAGAVYGYFRDKDDLILAIADRALTVADQLMDSLIETDPLPSLPDMLERITATILAQADTGFGDVTRVAVAVWAEAVRSERVHAMAHERFPRMRARYADLVRAQQEAGRVPADEDPDLIAKAFFGLVPGFVLQRLVIGDVDPESYGRALSGLMRSSLEVPPEAPSEVTTGNPPSAPA